MEFQEKTSKVVSESAGKDAIHEEAEDISPSITSTEESEYEILEHKPALKKTNVEETALMSPLKNKSSSCNNLLVGSDDYARSLQGISGSDDDCSPSRPALQPISQFSIAEGEQDERSSSIYGIGKFIYWYQKRVKQGKR